MNPRTRLVIILTALAATMGLLAFSQLFKSAAQADAATWPPRPGVLFGAPAETGSISGHVFKADGVSVITDETISVWALNIASGNSLSAIVSQADGSYSISGLAPGTYKVNANHDVALGYVNKWYDNKSTVYEADPIVISAGQTITGIDFNLEALGAISGHVFKADGVSVITDAPISVFASGQSAGANNRDTWVSQADGSYKIAGLAPGAYNLRANNHGHPSYVSKWYNNTYDWQQADTVIVSAGQTITGIDFNLETAGAISGHVFKADGVSVITGVTVGVRANGVSSGSNSAVTGVSQTDGSYTISGLAAGVYKVQGNSNGVPGYVTKFYNNKYAWDQADTVVVSAGQTTAGIDFNLEAGGAISGHVFKADGVSVITDVLISVHASGVSPNSSSLGTWVSQTDGSYTISGLAPGTYKVQGNNNRVGSYISEYYNNKLSWDQADVITVVAGQTTTGIDLALEPGGAISGHVYEQDGVTPVANACVNVSASAPDWNQIAGFCCTGSDGSFTITGVPVGRVYVRTHANCQNTHPDLGDEWYAAGGSTPDGSQASPVDVIADQTIRNIDFQLNRTTVIRGTIYNADGSQPIARAGIHYSPADNQNSYGSYCADDNGRFAITMSPGSYKFFARGDRRCGSDPNLAREYWSETEVWGQAKVITVTAEAPVVREITFTLDLGGSIWGAVRDSTSLLPIGGGVVRASSSDGLQTSFVCAEDDGTYVIPGLLLGDYKVYAGGGCRANSKYIAEYWQEKPSFELADIVALSASNRERRGIDFTLLLGSRISGTVFRSDGVTPVTDTPITITLYDATTGAVQAQTQTWPGGGSYGFWAFPPGAYRVKAWDPNGSGYFTEYYDNKPLEAQADILDLAAGQTLSGVSFSLDRGAVTDVPAATGATLVYTDTQDAITTIQVPAGAVTQTTTLVYTEVMTSTSPSGFAFAGHAFELAAYQDGEPAPGLAFSEPVTITINYTDADVAGMDEATLELRYWDGSAWSTEGITVIERDPANNRFMAAISHLSKFAAFAEPRRRLYLPLILRNSQ